MSEATTTDIEIPEEFICPITQEIMKDPVVSMYGQSYERSAILEWLSSGTHDCPLSRRPLTLRGIITNHQLRCRIRDWQIKNEMNVVLIADPARFPDEKLCAFVTLLEENNSDTERLSSSDDENEETRPISVRRVAENSNNHESRRQLRRQQRRTVGQVLANAATRGSSNRRRARRT